MFERFNQRKRYDFEQMKKNFNIDSIEAFSFFKHRDRSSERKRRERRKNYKDVKRDARNNAKDNAKDNAKHDAKDDITDKKNVFMKNAFENTF